MAKTTHNETGKVRACCGMASSHKELGGSTGTILIGVSEVSQAPAPRRYYWRLLAIYTSMPPADESIRRSSLAASLGLSKECPLWVDSGPSGRPSRALGANVRIGWKAVIRVSTIVHRRICR